MARTVWILSLWVPLLLLASACADDADSPCGDGFELDDSDRCVRWVEVQRVAQPAGPGNLLQLPDGRVLSWNYNEPMRVLTPDELRWDAIEPMPLDYVSAVANLADGSVLALGGTGASGQQRHA